MLVISATKCFLPPLAAAATRADLSGAENNPVVHKTHSTMLVISATKCFLPSLAASATGTGLGGAGTRLGGAENIPVLHKTQYNAGDKHY